MIVVETEHHTTTSTTTRRPTTTRKPTTTKAPSHEEHIPEEPVEPVESVDAVEQPASCSEQFAPHPTDCNKYYLCEHGRPLEQSCPPSLHWNANGNICDWPRNAKCEQTDPNRPTTSPRPTTTTTRKPRPPPPTDAVPTQPDDGKFKVVCYFTNWAWYRPGEGKYLPENIDENLCTHIVYGFAVLDGTSLTIKTHDSWADIDNTFYERVTAYRKKGIKVLIAIGGWNDSLGDKYR